MHFKSEDVFSLIKGLTREGFYGKVEVKIENGKIIHCTSEQSLKPSSTIRIIEVNRRSE